MVGKPLLDATREEKRGEGKGGGKEKKGAGGFLAEDKRRRLHP